MNRDWLRVTSDKSGKGQGGVGTADGAIAIIFSPAYSDAELLERYARNRVGIIGYRDQLLGHLNIKCLVVKGRYCYIVICSYKRKTQVQGIGVVVGVAACAFPVLKEQLAEASCGSLGF